MSQFLSALGLCGFVACSPALKYSNFEDGQDIAPGGMKFSVQTSTITLSQLPAQQGQAQQQGGNNSTGNNKSHNTAGGGQTPVPAADAVSQDSCVQAGVKPTPMTAQNWQTYPWWPCFQRVKAAVAIGPAHAADGSVRTYVVEPDDGWLGLTSTTLSGTPIDTQDTDATIYKTITIKYTSNAQGVIKTISDDAVTGFGMAGPWGALGGALLGIAAQAAPHMTSSQVSVAQLLCKDAKQLKFPTDHPEKLQAHLALPTNFDVDDARPFGKNDDINSKFDADGACWHRLANNTRLGEPQPGPAISPPAQDAPVEPTDGDGWLYRIVMDEDPTQPPATSRAVPTDTYFSDAKTGTRSDFPYSACRQAILEVTWWSELVTAVDKYNGGQGNVPNPNVLRFPVKIADSAFVSKLQLPQGGTINFNVNCGAYVALGANVDYASGVSAAITSAQNLLKAEKGSQASTPVKPKPKGGATAPSASHATLPGV